MPVKLNRARTKAQEQTDKDWKTLTQFVLHRHAQLRFRVAVEQHVNPTHGFEADEARAQQGRWVEREDAEQFARSFVATFASFLSPYDIERLVAALQAELDDEARLAHAGAADA